MRAANSKMATMLTMVYLALCNTLLAVVRAQGPPAVVIPPKPQDATVVAPQDSAAHNLAQSSLRTLAQAPATGHGTGSGSGHGKAEVKLQTPPNIASRTPSPPPPTSPFLPSSSINTTGDATPLAKPGTNTTTPAPMRTPGPAINPLPPGTNNCLIEPFCGPEEECFVLTDGLVCLPKAQNWGYFLSRNASGIPSVPNWSGPYSQLNDSCTRFQLPASGDKPALALLVYDLIRNTIPKDLLLSRFDQATTNWYTHYSNCESTLACSLGICQPRPALGESCTTSWQCNALALGLDDLNLPIPTANTTEMRCEYLDADKSVNTTCQLLHREKDAVHGFLDDNGGGGGGFSAWHVIMPVVVILILIYFGTIVYQHRMRQQKRWKWTRAIEDDRDDFRMGSYDEIH